jgi:hypothetical protein
MRIPPIVSVAVVSQSVVTRYFPNSDAVGHSFRLTGTSGTSSALHGTFVPKD